VVARLLLFAVWFRSQYGSTLPAAVDFGLRQTRELIAFRHVQVLPDYGKPWSGYPMAVKSFNCR
jgi:hypothetical protein